MSVIEVSETLAAGRAAQELRLQRSEFELAAQMGHVRTVGGSVSGRRRVARAEVDRLRAAEGFPDALRERVRMVGTAEGAQLMSISAGRFARLARAGYLVPVRFYLNRYRVIVWLYLAEELRAFATSDPALLKGRFPQPPCPSASAPRLDSLPGEDCPEVVEDRRPRNWRGRRIGLLLHESDGRWERAAIVGSVLDPVRLAELVPDPYERGYLNRLRPELAPGRPASEAGREALRRLLRADHPDEVEWHRSHLRLLLAEARRHGHAPRPAGTTPSPARTAEPVRTGRRRPLLTRLRIRRDRGPTARAPRAGRSGRLMGERVGGGDVAG